MMFDQMMYGSSGHQSARVDIESTTGIVQVDWPGIPANWISLDGIQFSIK